MTKRSVTHSSFTLERVYDAAPARVFRAFAEQDQKRRWFAESDQMETLEYSLDFRVGGTEHWRGKGGPTGDWVFTNDTVFHDIVQNERIIISYRMTANGAPISVSTTTFELRPDGMKTRLVLTEQDAFLEGGDGPEIRQEGWRGLLANLGKALQSEPSRAAR